MIELKGHLRSVSALDSNVYVLTNEGGTHIGDLTITDEYLIDKIDAAMTKKAIETGELRKGEVKRVAVVLPITLVMKVRK